MKIFGTGLKNATDMSIFIRRFSTGARLFEANKFYQEFLNGLKVDLKASMLAKDELK